MIIYLPERFYVQYIWYYNLQITKLIDLFLRFCLDNLWQECI